jgi:hypothetical protein
MFALVVFFESIYAVVFPSDPGLDSDGWKSRHGLPITQSPDQGSADYRSVAKCSMLESAFPGRAEEALSGA